MDMSPLNSGEQIYKEKTPIFKNGQILQSMVCSNKQVANIRKIYIRNWLINPKLCYLYFSENSCGKILVLPKIPTFINFLHMNKILDLRLINLLGHCAGAQAGF
jgi:hypothetical protein